MTAHEPDPATRVAIEAFLAVARQSFPISRAFLFGSRARRDHRPDSDADLAVFLSGDAGPFVKTKLAMADIAYDILLENGVLIQPWPIWESEWQRPDGYPNPALLASIRRDGAPM